VQTVLPMEGGQSALKLTTATYYVGKNERNIHRFPDSKEKDQWGVKPSDGWEVKQTDEERIKYFKWRRLRDVVLKKDQPAPKTEETDKIESDFRDRVLDKAREYIVGEQQKQGEAPARVVPGASPVRGAGLPPRPSASSQAYRQD